jgi:hypothetical protein
MIFSRRRALDEGALIDISKIATEKSFALPVAITPAVWSEWILPDERGKERGESEADRVRAVLELLAWAVKKSDGWERTILFVVLLTREGQMERVRLKAAATPDDDGRPALTIMCPHETIGLQ